MSVTLKKPPAVLSPARQALADEIARRHASDAELAAVEAAAGTGVWGWGKSREAITAAERPVEAARAALAEAQQRTARNMTLEALGQIERSPL